MLGVREDDFFEGESSVGEEPWARENLRTCETVVRVTYSDTDQMGMVYYANYLIWFEIGRTEFLRQYGLTYKLLEAQGMFLPVARCVCEYKSPAHYDDLIRIVTTIAQMTRVSITFSYKLVREGTGETIALGETKHACIGPDGKILKSGLSDLPFKAPGTNG